VKEDGLESKGQESDGTVEKEYPSPITTLYSPRPIASASKTNGHIY
jgi:hypothetical protein